MGLRKRKGKGGESPKQPEASKKKKKRISGVPRDLVNDVRYGRSLSLEFFRQNAWLLMLFVVAIIALMGLRYKTKTKMEEIKVLTEELQRAQSSKLQEKASYMSLIREAEMKKLVDEKNLGLQFQEYPPFELEVERQ
ncbi:MAG: hypothetical protein J1D77_02535 [Muribaculaceae bacterium]|nr:hypothetical protein [Muribaculaceae bacterium]